MPAAGVPSPREKVNRPDQSTDKAEIGKRSSKATASASRRKQILAGAAEMFAERGYYGSSLRAIAARAGVSHSGMLHHFSSKGELLHAVIDRLEAHAQDALDRTDELRTGPQTLLEGLAEVWQPGSHLIHLLARLDAEAVSKNHPARFRLARLRRVHEHVLQRCFTQLDERGLLREGIDPAAASRIVLALTLSYALREQTVQTMQTNPHHDSPETDLTALVQSFLVPEVKYPASFTILNGRE